VFNERFERQVFTFANDLGYSSYRINITKNKGDSDLMQIAEIELIGPQYASINHSTTMGSAITARAEISAGESGEKFFDGDINTKWLDNASVPSVADPSWAQIELPFEVVVNSIAVTSANDADDRDPENFSLLGSNDGETWFTIGEWAGQAWDNRFERKHLPLGNGRYFSIYRFNITKNKGDSDLTQIGKLELIGPDLQ
jgi:F5/8 type C domain